MLHPNYLQTHLLAAAHGARVRPWPLRLTGGSTVRWAPALDELRALVTERTRLIVLCNPNNSTGTCLTAAELDEVCAVAARRGAWVLSDEIYRGAERDGILTASAWGRYRVRLGSLRPGRRHVRVVEGLRLAGPANRLGRRPALAL